MLPRREAFFQDVRNAVRLEEQPRVTIDSDVLSEDRISRAIQGAARWLAPKVVENYAPEDFGGWSEELKERLRLAVSTFKGLASPVASDQGRAREHFATALAAFRTLTTAVREIVLTEWTLAVDKMLQEVEGWVEREGWRGRRVERKIRETLLGLYTLPQLQVFADADLYVLEPVARFVPGAAGAYDLSIQPSYYLTALYREFDGGWNIHRDINRGADSQKSEQWSADTFRASLEELRSLV